MGYEKHVTVIMRWIVTCIIQEACVGVMLLTDHKNGIAI